MKQTIEVNIDEALDWELNGQSLRQALVDHAESKMFAMPSVAPEGHFEIRVSLIVGHNPTDSPGFFNINWKPA